MQQLRTFADNRLLIGCIYCSGATETRDHVPSRVFLDEPYPENLPVIPACTLCNESFSLDEEYVACLIECARTGSVGSVERPKIRRILRDSSCLAARLAQARRVSKDGTVSFSADVARVKNVVLKLARGHAAYELSEQKFLEPARVMFAPLRALDATARTHFETPPQSSLWPEVGTRAMQRMVIAMPTLTVIGLDWIEVQQHRYRYFAIAEGPVMVRFVIGEYLACEVIWDA
jgi:hypothetical protein